MEVDVPEEKTAERVGSTMILFIMIWRLLQSSCVGTGWDGQARGKGIGRYSLQICHQFNLHCLTTSFCLVVMMTLLLLLLIMIYYNSPFTLMIRTCE